MKPSSPTRIRTYPGSCHCGEVRFEVQLDLSVGAGRCNCTFCTKAGVWGATVRPNAFRLLLGEDMLGDYSPAGLNHSRFCRRCGVRVFGHGDVPEIGGAFVSVNLDCLDDAELDGVPVRYFDGRNDTWEVLAVAPYQSPFVRSTKAA